MLSCGSRSKVGESPLQADVICATAPAEQKSQKLLKTLLIALEL